MLEDLPGRILSMDLFLINVKERCQKPSSTAFQGVCSAREREMRLPGYSAEVALGPAASRRVGRVGRTGGSKAIVAQQEFPPDRERPPIMGCDPGSVWTSPLRVEG